MMKKAILVAIGLGIVGVVVFVLFKVAQKQPFFGANSTPAEKIEVSAEVPFYDITIEGIRQTKIEDTTITIDEEVENEGSYTGYLAHYSSNGLQINGLLTIPTGDVPAGGFPAIVFLHGYIPPASYQTTTRYEDYVNYLASNGFVVFKIDYRGHGNSEGEPGGAYFSADYVIDTLAAVKALQSYDQVNPDKIGLWGHSMSGNVALRTAVINPSIKAVVIWAGAVYSYADFQAYRLNDNSYVRPTNSSQSGRSQRVFEQVGDVDATSPFWQAMAPTNYLTDLEAPIQLHHAENDAVVDIHYSRDLVAQLEAAKKPHELYEYSNGGHNLSGSAFSTAMSRTVDFFSTHLR